MKKVEGIISISLPILGFVCLFHSTANDSLSTLIVGGIIVFFTIVSVMEGYTPVAYLKILIAEIMEGKEKLTMKQEKTINENVGCKDRIINIDALTTPASVLENFDKKKVDVMFSINENLDVELDELSKITEKSKSQITEEALVYGIVMLKHLAERELKCCEYVKRPLGKTTIMEE